MYNNIDKIYLTSIFIIDWDDTLFPTTWVNKNNIELTNIESTNNYKLYFIELDKTISILLESLNKFGDIYIVTNANLRWIKSCLFILPLTQKLIIEKKIRIVSARDLHSLTTNSPTDWKILTFQNIIEDIINKINKNFKPNTIFNIISIGDAMYEYVALINLDIFLKKFTNCNFNYLLKSIKFIDKPDFDFVIDQIQNLNKNKNEIINKLEFIDLKFRYYEFIKYFINLYKILIFLFKVIYIYIIIPLLYKNNDR